MTTKTVNASQTCYRAFGPELIPVQVVSPQVTISYPPGGRLPLLFAKPAVTFQPAEHHRRLSQFQVILLGDKGT